MVALDSPGGSRQWLAENQHVPWIQPDSRCFKFMIFFFNFKCTEDFRDLPTNQQNLTNPLLLGLSHLFLKFNSICSNESLFHKFCNVVQVSISDLFQSNKFLITKLQPIQCIVYIAERRRTLKSEKILKSNFNSQTFNLKSRKLNSEFLVVFLKNDLNRPDIPKMFFKFERSSCKKFLVVFE